ncbi:MAG: response regulator, partial [Gammaproteobacteria bacterium]|nr:response regulator [Gammaproteobacteria bacterium]
ILDLSKLEANQVHLEHIAFSATEMVRSVTSVMTTLAEDKGLILSTEFDPMLPDVLLGDINRLRQVLMNLVSNAVKFTSSGSINISISLLSQNDNTAQLKFMVVDSGQGMTPEVQEKIFAPYSQANVEVARLYGGTGLGLFICRQLVQLMDGEIVVKSKPGKGSSFSFTVPVQIDRHSSLDNLHSKILDSGFIENRQPTRFLRVLQIEDNETNREVVERILQQQGHEIISVSNGREAIELIERAKYHFDAIITDRHMPEMDGIEATQLIRQMDAPFDSMPIIGITASVITDELEQCLAAGMDQVLPKPVSAPELLAVLAELTSRSATAFVPHDDRPVLVVDDVAANLKLASQQLAKLGINCELYQHSREALEAAKRGGFSVILVDNSMPELDGVGFTHQLRDYEISKGIRTPIIMVTGSASAEDRNKYFANGLDACLEKPVLLDSLKTMLEQWLQLPAPGETLAPAPSPQNKQN